MYGIVFIYTGFNYTPKTAYGKQILLLPYDSKTINLHRYGYKMYNQKK